MSNHWKLTSLVLSMAIGLGLALMFVAAQRQAGRQDAALALLAAVDRVDRQLAQASREFGIAVGDYLSDPDSEDLEIVRQAHRTLRNSVDRALQTVSRLEAPDSTHGEALITAQRRFVLVQRRIIRADFGRLVDRLEDDDLDPAAQRAATDEVTQRAFAATEQGFAQVASTREAFAKEFAIQLSVIQ